MNQNRFFGAVFLILVFMSELAFAGGSEIFHTTTRLVIGVILAAKIAGIACEKIGLPSLVGEIFGGIFLGNLALFGWKTSVAESVLAAPFFQYTAELGVVILLFVVGLESNLSDLLKVGGNALLTAFIGVILPIVGGFLAAEALGLGSVLACVLFGATFSATSVGITAKLLSESGKMNSKSAQIILGAAVVDDVLGLVILAALAGVAVTGTFSVVALGSILFKVFVFFAVSIGIGHFVLPQFFRVYPMIRQPGMLTVIAVMMALIFADAAYLLGLAPIVGGFTAGLLLDEFKFRYVNDIKIHNFEEATKPIMDLLLPIFFVSIGLQVKLGTLFDLHNLLIIGVLLLVSLATKAVCGLACRGDNIDKWGVGLGMIPRGEVGLIFAAFGLSQNIVSPESYSILVLVVLLTTIFGPVLLKTRLQKF